VTATLKKKLGVDVPGYTILGACNRHMAHQAMMIEPKVGAMLPCNVILREVEGGVEVNAIESFRCNDSVSEQRIEAGGRSGAPDARRGK
jgi:uncharacterized protein (DUF302 family)